MAKKTHKKDPKLLISFVEVDFPTVLPIWRDVLWPGRVSPIMPVSTMVFLGGYDMSIRANYTSMARFFAVYYETDSGNNLAGVFSGHPVSDTEYRARGLCVLPSFQNLGIGTNLVNAVTQAATDAGREVVWCLPRIANVEFFQSCGYSVMSGPITSGVEFGPNVYMAQAILSSK
jgi:GNAT superfamily N-acetyltransferase